MEEVLNSLMLGLQWNMRMICLGTGRCVVVVVVA